MGRLDEALERRLRAADGFQAVSREDGRVHAFFTYDTVEHARCAADLIEGVRKGFSVDTLEQREAQAAVRAQEALRAVSVGGSAAVQVPGMLLLDQVISDEEQAQFLAFVDAQPWDQLRLRRVQHYGHAFLYDRFNVDLSRKVRERCARRNGCTHNACVRRPSHCQPSLSPFAGAS